MRVRLMAAAVLALALVAGPVWAQDGGEVAAAEDDLNVNIELDLDDGTEEAVEGMAEDFAIVIQTMVARINTVRMNPDLADEEKDALAAEIQAEYQPQIDAFTQSIGGIISQAMASAGLGQDEADAQGAMIGRLIANAIVTADMSEPDAEMMAEMQADWARLGAEDGDLGAAGTSAVEIEAFKALIAEGSAAVAAVRADDTLSDEARAAQIEALKIEYSPKAWAFADAVVEARVAEGEADGEDLAELRQEVHDGVMADIFVEDGQ